MLINFYEIYLTNSYIYYALMRCLQECDKYFTEIQLESSETGKI